MRPEKVVRRHRGRSEEKPMLASIHRRLIPTAALILALLPRPATAQNLADLIPGLFGTRIILAPPAGGFQSHEAHFLDESLALAQTGRTLNASLLQQISSFPLASSAGGFTYTYDPTLGTFARTTDSFGPVFTERAQTIGRGKWNLGVNYQQTSYDKLDDLDLRNGDLQFQLRHQHPEAPGEPVQFFEGDVIGAQQSIDIKSSTAVLYANFGASDRFDLSIAVPVVKVEIAAKAVLTINRLSTFDQPTIHRFPDGGDTAVFAASDSASGAGDVVLRGKYRFWQHDAAGLAAVLSVRLPTGDEKNLLGTGATQTKLTLVGSGGGGRVGLHGNVGYAISSGGSDIAGDIPDELSYAAAVDFAVHPRLTLAGELVGRTLFDATRARATHVDHLFQAGPTGPTHVASLPEVTFTKDDLNLLLGSLGLKWNPGGNLLLSIDALYPLTSDGLRANGVTAVVGAEYTF
jgi:hypothetical protein